MSTRKRILCVGEILWDSLPSGIFLGGAPLNVCYHLNQLGIEASMAGKIGNDRLGKEAILRIDQMRVPTDFIQQDSDYETGFVSVSLNETGEPQYEFTDPAAWDFLELTDQLVDIAKTSWCMVFGSLAQRHHVSRGTICQLLKLDMLKAFDINLRLPYINKEAIHNSLLVTDILKVNEEEFNKLKKWCGLNEDDPKAVEVLSQRYNISLICVTRGANGAAIYRNGDWIEHHGYPVRIKDAVGAGDAFLAGLLSGILQDKEPEELLKFANATGALVAQKDGATPVYSRQDIFNKMEI